ncbi:MAG: hypothetical protein V1853_05185 [bacterium]
MFESIPWRKIIYIAAFLIAVFIIGLLLYMAFIAPAPTEDENSNELSNGQLPNVNGDINRTVDTNANTGQAVQLTNISLPAPTDVANGGKTIAPAVVDTQSKFLSLAGNGVDMQYYDPLTGKFYKLDRTGAQRTIMTDQIFKGVEDVTWAPNKDVAVLGFQDGANITYDFRTKKQATLPTELEEFSFSPDSTKLAAKFIGPTPGDNWLAIINSDGSEAQVIEPLGEKASQVTVNWSPNSQIVATYQQSINAERQEIIPLGLQGENFKSIETNGRGFEGMYDQSGARLLYSVYNSATSYNPELYIVQSQGNSLGRNNQHLGVNTWPDKCSFGSNTNTVYCAVPIGLPRGSGLYPELSDSLPYEFYQIDIASGSKQLLAQPTDTSGTAQYSVDKVFLSAQGDQLYFSDGQGLIRTIKLK